MQLGKRQILHVEICAEFFGAFVGTVGKGNGACILRPEPFERPYSHSAGPDDKGAFVIDTVRKFEYALDRDGPDRKGPAAGRGHGPHEFARGYGMLEKTVEVRAGGFMIAAQMVSVPYLA